MSCGCNNTMDIRSRCYPWSEPIQFTLCPARFDTCYWLINHSDMYTYVARAPTKNARLNMYISLATQCPYRLPLNSVLVERMTDLFEDDQEDLGFETYESSSDSLLPHIFSDDESDGSEDSEEYLFDNDDTELTSFLNSFLSKQ